MKKYYQLVILILFVSISSWAQNSNAGFIVTIKSETTYNYEHPYTKPLINENGLIVGSYEIQVREKGYMFHVISYKGKTVEIPALANFYFCENTNRIIEIGSSAERHVSVHALIKTYDLEGNFLNELKTVYHAPYVGYPCHDGNFILAARKGSPDSILYLMKFSRDLKLIWEQSFSNFSPQNIKCSPNGKSVIFIAGDYKKIETHTLLINGKNGRIQMDLIDLNTVRAIEFKDDETLALGGGNLVKFYNIKERILHQNGTVQIPFNVSTDFAITFSPVSNLVSIAHCREGGILGTDVSIYNSLNFSKLATIEVSHDRYYKRYRILNFAETYGFELFTPLKRMNYEYSIK
jgi:hypothetical protein